MSIWQLAKLSAVGALKYNEGIIEIKGRNAAFVPLEVLLHMHDDLVLDIGEAAAAKFMFDQGRFQTYSGTPRYLADKKDLSKQFLRLPMTGNPSLEMGWEVLRFAGWGDNRLESASADGATLIVKTVRSPLAETYLKTKGRSQKPVCHYLRGVLSGVVEVVYGGCYESRETTCAATGLSASCIFEFVKTGAPKNAQKGAPAAGAPSSPQEPAAHSHHLGGGARALFI